MKPITVGLASLFERLPVRAPVAVLVCGFAIALAACNSDPGTRPTGITSGNGGGSIGSSTQSVAGIILSPIPIPLVPAPVFSGPGCPVVQPFSTSFALVISGQPETITLDQVTFHFIDGSNAGGSPLLMSAADLSARFGNTAVTSGTSRSFEFQPSFGCGLTTPQALGLTVVLLKSRGQAQNVTMTVPIR